MAQLSLEEKRRLWEMLEEDLEAATDEETAEVEAEVREPRAAYEAGNYVTLDEYVARQDG